MGGRSATGTDLRTDLRHARHVARVELVRSVRAVLTDRRQLLAFGFVVLAFLPAGVVFLSGSYAAGVAVRQGIDVPVRTLARAQVAAWVGSTAVLFGLRQIERAGDVDHAALLLTTVSPRAVATGLVLAEFGRVVGVFGTPIVLLVSAFAYGAGAPLLVPVVLVGAVPILAVGTLGGFALGYLARLGFRRVGGGDVPLSVASVVGVLAVVVAFNVYAPADPARLLDALSPLGRVPVGPYADFLLVTAPFGVAPGVESAVGAAMLLGLVPLLTVAVWRLAPRTWYADPPVETDGDESPRFGSVRAPGPLAATRTLRLVWWQWLRGLRAPSQFVHVTYFLFMSFPMAQLVFDDPTGPLVPVFAGAMSAMLAGGTFGLNPLGMEGSMLPAVLTTPSPGRALVRARVLAGTLLWTPLGLLVVAGFGVAGTLGPLDTALVAAFVVVFSLFSCALALALGAFSPRFDTVQAFGGVEAPTPTTVALLGHTLVGAVVAALGLLAVFVPVAVDGLPVVSAAPRAARIAALAFWACGTLAVGAVCYRYAVRRVNGFRYE